MVAHFKVLLVFRHVTGEMKKTFSQESRYFPDISNEKK